MGEQSIKFKKMTEEIEMESNSDLKINKQPRPGKLVL